MINNNLLPKLSQNLLEILNDEEYYDIIIEVVLRYIYGGKISLEEYDILDIVKVMVAANELSLQELIPYLESFLIENKTNWVEQNFDLIYQISLENDSFSELQKYCGNLIAKEPNKIFNSPNSRKTLDHAYSKWGLAKNPELPSDPTSFSKDDFNTLKKTLQQCIPFIRFRNLSSKEFLKGVKPYKKILPKELYNDLLEYFLDNDSKKSIPRIIKEDKAICSKNIDSKIITLQHAELISKWIDKLEITDKLITLYEFKLLYRDSHDGPSKLNFAKFQEICKNQYRTVIVIKVKDSNVVIGGYNPIEWKFDGSHGVTKDSFIFSFSNNSIEDYILSRVINEKRAIYNGNLHVVAFNSDLLLCIDNGVSVGSIKNSYEKKIRIDSSLTEEFEVFQIV
ncbi:carbohydrate-binding module family 13 protein [Rhizophagus clarus]|uniref:Carbohydrate-binding module family 13 protein n=1 Tax=Rhizophagus clarus TaxID=94130 RepID=A0A8H3KZS5_9GLOM|nr:carbohydrate-binding module family 13 protein [Rhizophagus clarus]